MNSNRQKVKNLIQSYSFGSMKIGGREYKEDIIVFPDHIEDSWWRERGHSLSINDLKTVMDYQPEILVIGKGASGVMNVPAKVKERLKKEGIKVVAEQTTQAYKTFNNLLKENKKAVGAFHLTC